MKTAAKKTKAKKAKVATKATQADKAKGNALKFPDFANASSLIIMAGIVVLAYAATSAIGNYRKYNSPFDAIDQATENQSGLLPVLEAEASADLSSYSAPEITANEASQLAQNYSQLSTLSAEDVLFAKIALDTLSNPLIIGLVPDRLIIPSLDLFVDIRPVSYWEINFEGSVYRQWDTVDEYATGWHNTSARVGVPGNTVISGHHNVHGKVFENLYTLDIGDVVQVKTAGNKLVTYRVAKVLVLEEKFQPLEVRLENARWIQTSENERLTLVTCFPNDDNSHRVIVIALPIES
jgi:sortase A